MYIWKHNVCDFLTSMPKITPMGWYGIKIKSELTEFNISSSVLAVI